VAAWVRDGDAPNEVKVSFVVSKADHPELVEWLWGLPFRKQSEVIRDVLSKAAKMVSSGAAPAKSEEMQTRKKPMLASAPAVTPSSETQLGGGAMTAATAAILRNMQQDF